MVPGVLPPSHVQSAVHDRLSSSRSTGPCMAGTSLLLVLCYGFLGLGATACLVRYKGLKGGDHPCGAGGDGQPSWCCSLPEGVVGGDLGCQRL